MKKRFLSIMFVMIFFVNGCFVPEKASAIEFDSQALINWLYKSETEMAKGVTAMLNGEEEPTYEIVKDLYLKLSTIYGMIDVSETIPSTVECLMNDISFFDNMITGAIMIIDNWPAFNESDYAIQEVVDGFQTGFGVMKMLGLSKYVPSGLSFACTAIEMGITAGGILEKAYLVENLSLYVLSLETAVKGNLEIPLPEPPQITIGSQISQEEVDAIFYSKYMEYSLKRIMANLPAVEDNTYQITYNSNCSEVSNITRTYNSSENAEYIELERENYIFDGWYFDSACTDKVEEYSNENQTWYAKWVSIFDYKIANGEVTIFGIKEPYIYYDVKFPGELDGCYVTKILLPVGMTSLTVNTFARCTKVKEIFISASITDMADNAFRNCEKLRYITVDINNQYFSNDEYGVLYDKSKNKLIKFPVMNPCESFSIPGNVENIGISAFDNADNLKKVVFSNKTRIIEECAFYSCTNLEVIINVSNVEMLGNEAFKACMKLDGILEFSKAVSVGNGAFAVCPNVKGFEFGTDLKRIGSYAFASCVSAESIVVADGTSEIGEQAFTNCSSLKEFRWPSGVDTIPYGAFEGSLNLNRVYLPASLKKVSGYAFDWSADIYFLYDGTPLSSLNIEDVENRIKFCGGVYALVETSDKYKNDIDVYINYAGASEVNIFIDYKNGEKMEFDTYATQFKRGTSELNTSVISGEVTYGDDYAHVALECHYMFRQGLDYKIFLWDKNMQSILKVPITDEVLFPENYQ